MVKDFKEFVLRGNVVDLAVGFVIGAAFGSVVTSFVENILTPLSGLLGVPDFSELAISVGPASMAYGLFVNAVIAFTIIAASVFFLVVKPVNRLVQARKSQPEPESPNRPCPHCLSDIPKAATRCAFCTQEVPETS